MSGDPVAGLVLAGGKSRRMGGGDKFLLELGGRTLLDRVLARLEAQAGDIAVSANCDPALLAGHSCPVLPDPPPAGRGPLAGIMAGLDWAASRTAATHIVTVASDTPFFPTDLVRQLTDAGKGSGEIVLAASAKRVHPVFGLWPVSSREVLRTWLDAGSSLKVTDFADRHGWCRCAFEVGADGDPFFNINTPDDLAAAAARLAEAFP